MSYGLKFKLEYCQRKGGVNVPLRVEILQRDYVGVVRKIEGGAKAFILRINNQQGKEGNFRTTEARMTCYQDDYFKLDNLLTSDELMYRVDFYENSIKMWSGFVIPDFFSETLGTSRLLNITASDRLTALKGETLAELGGNRRLGELLQRCLAATGLSLDLWYICNIKPQGMGAGSSLLDVTYNELRIHRDDNKTVSCYDIIDSILTLSGAYITQHNGFWVIINRVEIEAEDLTGYWYDKDTYELTDTTSLDMGVIPFTQVLVGARREVSPLASQVGVYGEYGGEQVYPTPIRQTTEFWTTQAATFANDNRIVYGYSGGEPVWSGLTGLNRIFYTIEKATMTRAGLLNPARIISPAIPILNPVVNVGRPSATLTIRGGGAGGKTLYYRVSLYDALQDKTLWLRAQSGDSYKWQELFVDSTVKESVFSVDLQGLATDYVQGTLKLDIPLDILASGSYLKVHVLGSAAPVFLDDVQLRFKRVQDEQKGVISKILTEGGYTYRQDLSTVIFHDSLYTAINGYYYTGSPTDTSALRYGASNTYRWTTPYDATPLPLLQHITRQRAILYSAARNVFNVELEDDYLPLSIYTCGGKKYVLTACEYDYLTRKLRATLEEIKYDVSAWREYIYTYFGDGDDVRSVAGITAGVGLRPAATSDILDALKEATNLLTFPTTPDWEIDGIHNWHFAAYVWGAHDLTEWYALRSNKIDAAEGETFTLTGYITNAANKPLAMQIAEYNLAGDLLSTVYWDADANGVQEVTFTLTTPATDHIRLNWFYQETMTGNLLLGKFMLIRGSIPMAWQPAQTDVATDEGIRRSVAVEDNTISILGKDLILTGTTIAEAIKAGDLDVGDGNFHVGQDGIITAKGATIEGDIKTSEAGRRVEVNKIDNTIAVYNADDEVKIIIKPTKITKINDLAGDTWTELFDVAGVSVHIDENEDYTYDTREIELPEGKNYQLTTGSISYIIHANTNEVGEKKNDCGAAIHIYLCRVEGVEVCTRDLLYTDAVSASREGTVTKTITFTRTLQPATYRMHIDLVTWAEQYGAVAPEAYAELEISASEDYTVKTIDQFTEVGTDGLVSVTSPTNYTHISETGFISRYGNTLLRLGVLGLQKSTDGGATWITL